MPTIAASRIQVPATYSPASRAAPASPVMPMPLPTHIIRSPVMIASLPGTGSGPDAVIRQFNDGTLPQNRIHVPGQ